MSRLVRRVERLDWRVRWDFWRVRRVGSVGVVGLRNLGVGLDDEGVWGVLGMDGVDGLFAG